MKECHPFKDFVLALYFKYGSWMVPQKDGGRVDMASDMMFPKVHAFSTLRWMISDGELMVTQRSHRKAMQFS